MLGHCHQLTFQCWFVLLVSKKVGTFHCLHFLTSHVTVLLCARILFLFSLSNAPKEQLNSFATCCAKTNSLCRQTKSANQILPDSNLNQKPKVQKYVIFVLETKPITIISYTQNNCAALSCTDCCSCIVAAARWASGAGDVRRNAGLRKQSERRRETTAA